MYMVVLYLVQICNIKKTLNLKGVFLWHKVVTNHEQNTQNNIKMNFYIIDSLSIMHSYTVYLITMKLCKLLFILGRFLVGDRRGGSL